jgi:hypothetical protein
VRFWDKQIDFQFVCLLGAKAMPRLPGPDQTPQGVEIKRVPHPVKPEIDAPAACRAAALEPIDAKRQHPGPIVCQALSHRKTGLHVPGYNRELNMNI